MTSARLLLIYIVGAVILTVTAAWFGWETKRGVEKSLAIEVQTLGGQLGHYLADLITLDTILEAPVELTNNSVRQRAHLAQEMAESRTQNFLLIAEAYPQLDLSIIRHMDRVLESTARLLNEEPITKAEAELIKQSLSKTILQVRQLLTQVSALGVDTVAVQAEQLKNFQIAMIIYLGLFILATLTIFTLIARGRRKAEEAQALLEQTVTERTKALAEKSDLLETTLRSVDQGITVFDENMNVLLVNDRFCDLLGFPSSFKSPGRQFEEFMRYNAQRGEYGPGDVETIVADKVAEAKRFKPYRLERTRPNGTVLELVGRAKPGGGMVTTFADVTSRIKIQREAELAREAAEKASTAKSEFLANMSHELRTPLNGIMGFAQLLLMPRANPMLPEDREYVEIILKAGEHLLDLINDILDLAKIESGNIVLAPECVSLHEILRQCFELVSPIAQKSRVTLNEEIVLATVDSLVYADPVRLKQCIVNLLSNGVKYNVEGGRVDVSYERQPLSQLRITVADTGLGIPDGQIGSLFSPFVRLDQQDKTIEGTGVGLALTKTLAELMGGGVGVASREGKGSRFWIDIPTAPIGVEISPN